MFKRLIHYLESGTDDVHGYVNELLDTEKKINELEEKLARAEERLKRVQYKSHKNAYKVFGHFCQAVIDNKAIHDSIEQYFKDKEEEKNDCN